MKRTIIPIIGFLLFILGFLGLILSLIGLRLSIISFLDDVSPLFGFLVKILMVMTGIIVIYLSRTSDDS